MKVPCKTDMPNNVQPISAVPAGTVVESFPDELRVATGDGELSVAEIQGASGKRLKIKDFLHGHPIPSGTKFK